MRRRIIMTMALLGLLAGTHGIARAWSEVDPEI